MPLPAPPIVRVPLELPIRKLTEVPFLQTVLNYAPFKVLMPLPILAAVAPAIWWFFRPTWRELDDEAASYRAGLRDRGEVDYRPMACFVIVAAVLTMQEYYGSRSFYEEVLREPLQDWAQVHTWFRAQKYDELLGYAWWSAARFIGYVLIPLPLWKVLFPKDSLLDMGLRTRGFFEHFWVYGLCLGIVLPLMLLVSTQPDFGNYYPFYKTASRSWLDFLLWEGMYWLQFFSLELFFRGWMVGALRHTMGAGAIFAMALPYCMIHYGKPYFEAHGAVIAGVVLGSLSMRTRSIYAGFLVHITVAVGMDLLSLWKRAALPVTFWSPG
ncbi:MAG TPA: CPBP family intramembrane glutamic endopeptidase [Polyangiaceae bacterium]|nr:CPBP family intramembrane glutamic endopeptidase [Polyangiaceae bacterium]